jgi:hypothetical protein
MVDRRVPLTTFLPLAAFRWLAPAVLAAAAAAQVPAPRPTVPTPAAEPPAAGSQQPGAAAPQQPIEVPPPTRDPSAPATVVDAKQPTTPTALDDTTTAALESLAHVLAQRRKDLDAARTSRDRQAVNEIENDIRQISWQFASLVARANVREFESPAAHTTNMREDLEQLVRPLIAKLRDVTAGPREIADLEERLELLGERKKIADAARAAATATRDLLPPGSAARDEADRELTRRWQPTVDALSHEILVLEANLARAREERGSFLTNVTRALHGFVQSSGATLILALLVFALVYVGLRRLARLVTRRPGDRGFARRLVEVLLRVLVVLLSVLAMLVVPYALDDWFLLALGVVFLIGAGWIVMRAAPQFAEQMRLMLNVGGVREGERMIVDGLPFRVESLRFHARLVNPDLDGGTLRVPVQYLVGKRSRPSGANEPWFPTRTGDTVRLADGMVATVRSQSPETVVLEYRGSPQSYPTLEYLERCPRNLSRGFVAEARLVVARTELTHVTTELCERLRRALHDAVSAQLGPGHLRHVHVTFERTTPLGFQLLALAECDGAAAPRYLEIERTLHRAFVDACREHGWSLPAAPAIATAGGDDPGTRVPGGL